MELILSWGIHISEMCGGGKLKEKSFCVGWFFWFDVRIDLIITSISVLNSKLKPIWGFKSNSQQRFYVNNFRIATVYTPQWLDKT